MRKSVLILPFVLVACTEPAPVGVATRSATEVAGCEYVKTIVSTPGVFGLFAQAGLEDARNGVLKSAAASGANTVVFTPVEPGERVFSVEGIAYRC